MDRLSSVSGALLTIEGVTVVYPNRPQAPVLENFSLDVKAAGFLAVVGPSGCGKSTLLHTIAGFLRPVSGCVRLKGRLISEPCIHIGFVGQRYALFPWLTVWDNIAFGLRSQGRPEPDIRAIVDRLLGVVGLETHGRYYPEQMSGGMQQRAALARAMAPDPTVLLLDEPFSALDTETRRRMRDLLLQLWGGRETIIIFVTHDIEEALLLADNILILTADSGKAPTIDVPFRRPRAHDLQYTSSFRDLRDRILRDFIRLETSGEE